MNSNDTLQALCREYLTRLRPLAEKFGLGWFVDDTVKKNMRHECAGTDEEVEALGRMCDDERMSRADIPELFGISYRQCIKNGLFNRIRRLREVGVYSKVSALMAKSDFTEQEDGKDNV